MEKVRVKSSRDNFYFHDSYKGFSHGYIETSTELFYDFAGYKKMGQKRVEVQVKYPGLNRVTNGGTYSNPPPWTNEMRPTRGGERIPVPKPGAFPDRTRM